MARPVRKLFESVALLLVTLAAMEIGLQGLARWQTDIRLVRLINAQTYSVDDPDLIWKKRFIERYRAHAESALSLNQNEFQTDPELGWRPKNNVRLTNAQGQTVTTNSLGFRSLEEYAPDPTRYTVLIVGDSFTYGSRADDEEVWPTILQSMDPGLRVLNMAVAGYGVDQMYLMLERHIGRFAPDLVILAFIDDDIRRSGLSFRDFQKPKLEIEDGELVLTNVPIGSVDEVARAVEAEERERRRTQWPGVKLVNLVKRAYWAWLVQGADKRNTFELNERIVLEAIELTKPVDAEFMLVFLPAGRSLVAASAYTEGEEFFDAFVQTHAVHSLNPRSLFLESDAEFSRGHYRYAGARLVAEAVHAAITELRGSRGEDPPR